MKTTYALAFLLLTFVSSFSQSKPARLAEITHVVTPAITINPRNPLNVLAVTAEQIFVSMDGGKTWETQSNSAAAHGDPFLMSDHKGTMFLFNQSSEGIEHMKGENNGDAIICKISDNGGKTWSADNPVWLSEGKGQMNPAATMDSKGNLYLSWTETDKNFNSKNDCKTSIFLSSSGNGRKWSKPVQISNGIAGCPGDGENYAASFPAAADDKKVYVTWLDKNKICLDRSFDSGSMWLSTDLEVTTEKEGFNTKINGLNRSSGMPTFLVDKSKTTHNGLLYMVYADQRFSGTSEIWFLRSNDFGDHWTSAVSVSNGKEKTNQFSPWMTVDKTTGIIYVLYYSQAPETGETDVYLAYSRDAGTTFKNSKISDKAFLYPEKSGLFLSVAAQKGSVTGIWLANEGGKYILYTSSIADKDLR